MTTPIPIPLPITSLTAGDVQATDVYPAVDTLDDTQSTFGTTKKYSINNLAMYIFEQLGFNVLRNIRTATTTALTVVYDNGTAGVNSTITNAGTQAALVIDDIVMMVGDRFLVKDQVDPAQNGIYVVTTTGSDTTNWVATRPTDFNQASNIIDLSVALINEGTVNANLVYQLDYTPPLTVGTTPLPWGLFDLSSASLITYPIALDKGGTGSSLVAANGAIPYCNASAIVFLAPGTSGQFLQSTGAGAPQWTTASFPVTPGVLGSILISDGNDWIESTSLWPNTVGAAGKILRSDGITNAYSTSTFADTYALNSILYASVANTITELASVARSSLSTDATGIPTWLPLTDGEIVIGSTAGAPAAATITGGTGITVTIGSNSIQIDSTGSGVTWNSVAGTTQAAAVDNAYICANAGATTVTLPATAAIGATVQIEGQGAGGWILQANTGQTIQIGSGVTSSAGTLTSAAATDNVQVVCIVANTTWRVQRTNSAGLTIA